MAQDNEIHSLRFTPKTYRIPRVILGKYLVTSLLGKKLTTVSGKNIIIKK
jgi:hypothetical protein